MSKKKVLIITSVASMIDQFLLPNIRLLKSMGYEVEVAANFVRGSTCSEDVIDILRRKLKGMGICCHQVDFERNIVHVLGNARAYTQLEKIIRKNKYAFVHCHSPAGGLLGRIVARKHGIKTIYTAHGFHFYTGAPAINWILYYPAEKILSRLTDVLVTVNQEDFRRAEKDFSAKKTFYVPGVGIDMEKFAGAEKNRRKKREELGLGIKDVMLLAVGELNKNKNHEMVIDALGELQKKNAGDSCRLHFFIAGKGRMEGRLLKQSEAKGVRIRLLGYRKDIPELLGAADLFIHPSKREGMPVAMMEAVAAQCPVLCSDIRGNRVLVWDAECRFPPDSPEALAEKILAWRQGELIPDAEGNYRNLKKYDRSEAEKEMRKIYCCMGR